MNSCIQISKNSHVFLLDEWYFIGAVENSLILVQFLHSVVQHALQLDKSKQGAHPTSLLLLEETVLDGLINPLQILLGLLVFVPLVVAGFDHFTDDLVDA